MKFKNLMVKFYLGSMSWFTKTARFALRVMNSKWFKVAVGVYLVVAWYSAIDNIVDTLYWDEERKCVMQSVTVYGGDVEQIPFE